MRIPVNYAEWCALFDEIAASPRDEAYLDAIARGQISFTSGVAERFVRAATDLIRKRVNAAQDVYQRQLKNARGMNSNVTTALSTLKKEYVYVHKIAKALPIPPEYRSQIVKMVQDQADMTQRSLEDSAKADRTGHLMQLVRGAGMNKLG